MILYFCISTTQSLRTVTPRIISRLFPELVPRRIMSEFKGICILQQPKLAIEKWPVVREIPIRAKQQKIQVRQIIKIKHFPKQILK